MKKVAAAVWKFILADVQDPRVQTASRALLAAAVTAAMAHFGLQ